MTSLLGFNMPGWQNHPTMSAEDEWEWWRNETSVLAPRTPTDETAIGGAGQAGQEDEEPRRWFPGPP